jgi:hypothetical protein
MTAEELQPINDNWIAPMMTTGGDAALCRDTDGNLWLCHRQAGTAEWVKQRRATRRWVEGFMMCQLLSGKDAQTWPEGELEES